jgi:hypothetical protein
VHGGGVFDDLPGGELTSAGALTVAVVISSAYLIEERLTNTGSNVKTLIKYTHLLIISLIFE